MIPSKTTIAVAGAALLLALLLGRMIGLGPSTGTLEDEPVTIRFWNGFTGPDGRTMLRLVKQFNQQNPDVRVLMQRMDWSIYYNKLFVAGLGGRAPEVFVAHNDVLPRFHRAGLLRPLDDLLGDGALDVADFDPNVWHSATFDNQLVALPLDVHPLGLYYNIDLLKQVGIVDPHGNAKPPATRDEFIDALRRLKSTDRWGLVYTWLRTNAFAIMQQFNGRMFTDDFSRCTLDDEANVQALQFCVDLIREGLVAPPQNIDSWIGFRQGKVGMVFEGIYMLPDLQRQGNLPYAGAPMPLLGHRRATWASSHTLCLRKDLGGRELHASWRFIKFLSDQSLDWAAGGQVPVRKSLRNTERFEKMAVQRQFARQIPYVCYKPRVPFILEFDAEFDLAVERALRGTVSPQQALQDATRRLNAVIERDRQIYQQAGVNP